MLYFVKEISLMERYDW